MPKITGVKNTTVQIETETGKVIDVSRKSLNFTPQIGDEIKVFKQNGEVVVAKQAASVPGRKSAGKATSHGNFSTWKLVSGILSMVLFVLVSFQSCVAGLGNTISQNGEVGGSAGIIVAIMLLSGGIVSVATRKSVGKGGDIALVVLFGIGAFLGILLAGSFGDLVIWGIWCLVNAVLALICAIRK